MCKPVITDPKEKAKLNLLSDYGEDIDRYLKQLVELNGIQNGHLLNHKITGVYRAKMIDWMVEVLTAFKCSD
jgi:cyclin B